MLALSTSAVADYYVVDKNGSGDFSRIMDAINVSKSGDHIFVCGGTYNDSLIVDKSIKLVGDENRTIIVCNTDRPVVNITADNVSLEGFVITNCSGEKCKSGSIEVRSNECKLLNNTISNSSRIGIIIFNSSNHVISGNSVHDNERVGIALHNSSYNEISNNEIYLNGKRGIGMSNCEHNFIVKNAIYSNAEYRRQYPRFQYVHAFQQCHCS